MNKKEKCTLKKNNYTCPDFKVVEIRFEQSILANGSDGGANLPPLENEPYW